MSITWSQALAWRLQRQLLEPVGDVSVPVVVSRLGAVLATDEGSAQLAVGARRVGSRPAELRQALADGGVIKGFAFRESIRQALEGQSLTIRDLGAVVTRQRRYRHLRSVFEDGAGTLIKALSWQGDICFGPPRGGQHTVQRLADNLKWAGIWELDKAGPMRSRGTCEAMDRRPTSTFTIGLAMGSAPGANVCKVGSRR